MSRDVMHFEVCEVCITQSKVISFYKGKFGLGLYERRKQRVIHLPES